LGTQLNLSSPYHPQTDAQTRRVNQVLEGMLRGCALQYGRTWDKNLPYARFSYNNSYEENLNMFRLRCYMVVGAELRCFGVRLENRRFLDPTYCKKPRDKFVR
jgi:hypothetical protein